MRSAPMVSSQHAWESSSFWSSPFLITPAPQSGRSGDERSKRDEGRGSEGFRCGVIYINSV